jgi:hypothetical protein
MCSPQLCPEPIQQIYLIFHYLVKTSPIPRENRRTERTYKKLHEVCYNLKNYTMIFSVAGTHLRLSIPVQNQRKDLVSSLALLA